MRLVTLLVMLDISRVTSEDNDDSSDMFDDCSEEAVDCSSALRPGQFLCLDLDIDTDTQQVHFIDMFFKSRHVHIDFLFSFAAARWWMVRPGLCRGALP